MAKKSMMQLGIEKAEMSEPSLTLREEECPQCHSRERRKLNEACQCKPFQPIHLKQYHPWHDVTLREEPAPKVTDHKYVSEVCHESGCQFLVQREQQQQLISALAIRSPNATWTGNAEQFVDCVMNNLADVDRVLPDSLNRSLVERIQGLLDRANSFIRNELTQTCPSVRSADREWILALIVTEVEKAFALGQKAAAITKKGERS
jgi:RNA polymerase subunit RPABC4/transcription elongation factor Spt4